MCDCSNNSCSSRWDGCGCELRQPEHLQLSWGWRAGRRCPILLGKQRLEAGAKCKPGWRCCRAENRLCPAVAPGDRSSRKGHLAPCHPRRGTVSKARCWGLCCWQHPKKQPRSAKPLGWTGEAGVSPKCFPSALGRCPAASWPGHRRVQTHKGTGWYPQGCTSRPTLTSCFVTPGLPPLGAGHCRARPTPG